MQQLEMLGLALKRHVQGLIPEIDVAMTVQARGLSIEQDLLRIENAALRIRIEVLEGKEGE